ncbi:PAS domain-containing methyl-accepting chemotaxis protein [Acidovorax sp. SUPP3334]|uniref:PAS domain-containing methyl-accepting chemotaxis protein n=1 Tax=Acidovorax sp. SUPP3334 TaxID=2920881 RepID=UPI0023DE3179|nr:PAS domain-containing methyl-accepting chemotaxis protein [Acidovorax sp. SUPP3334]GKT24273.1 hypothetical protein AVHM3334_14240 [Acidovorax sp. SUPP3334]
MNASISPLPTPNSSARTQGLLAALERVQCTIEFDLDGRIQHANPLFLGRMGYTLEEVVGQHHSLFCSPEVVRSAEYARLWERLGRGEVDAGRYRRVGKGGADVWIQASYNPVLDSSGKPYKVVKFATDITAETRQAAETKGKLDAIGLSQAVIEFSVDGSILTANPNFLRTMGYTLDEIRSRHHSMFCDPAFVKTQVYRDFWADLGEGKFQSGRYRRIGKHEAGIWIQATYNPIFDPDGRVYKVVKFAVNVTEQVEREEAVAQKVKDIGAVLHAISVSIEQVARSSERSAALATQTQREAGEGNQLLARSREAIAAIEQSSTDIRDIVVPLPPVELSLPGGGLTAAISELRGRKLPLVAVAGQPVRAGAPLPPWVAVLERQGLWIGLMADTCRQLADLAESDLALTPGEPFLKGMTSVPGVGTLRVLDIDRLFDAVPEAAMSRAAPGGADATAGQATDAGPQAGDGDHDGPAVDSNGPVIDSHFLVFEAGALYATPVDSVVGVAELPQPTIDELALGRPAVMPWRGKTLKVVSLPSLDGSTIPMVPRMAILLEPLPPGHATVAIAISRLCDWLQAHRADHREMRLGALGEFRMITHEHEGNSASMVVVDLGEMAYLLG